MSSDADPFLRGPVRHLRGCGTFPPGATLKNSRPASSRSICITLKRQWKLAADHWWPEARRQGVSVAARMRCELHGEALRPEWAGCSMHVHISLLDAAGKNILAGTSKRRAVRGFAPPRDHGGPAKAMPVIHGDRRADRERLSALPAGQFSVPVAPNFWGRNHRGALRSASRCRASPTARVEYRPGGADGKSYLVLAAILAGVHYGITNKVEPGPMVAQESIIDGRSMPIRWSAALDAFDAGKILPVPRGEIPPARTASAGARKRSASTRRSATATTSGTCGPCSCA